MHKDYEKRHLKGIEVRAVEGKPGVLAGYAAVFDSPSEDLGGFVEIVRKGAFAESLSSTEEIMALCCHDWDEPLARRSKGTLKLEEDEKGLRVEITLADTTRAKDLLADVNAGNVEGMSFGFRVKKEAWTAGKTPADPATRELLSVELYEVSATTIPAYPDTTLAARSLDKLKAEQTPQPDPEVMKRINDAHLKLLSL